MSCDKIQTVRYGQRTTHKASSKWSTVRKTLYQAVIQFVHRIVEIRHFMRTKRSRLGTIIRPVDHEPAIKQPFSTVLAQSGLEFIIFARTNQRLAKLDGKKTD